MGRLRSRILTETWRPPITCSPALPFRVIALCCLEPRQRSCRRSSQRTSQTRKERKDRHPVSQGQRQPPRVLGLALPAGNANCVRQGHRTSADEAQIMNENCQARLRRLVSRAAIGAPPSSNGFNVRQSCRQSPTGFSDLRAVGTPRLRMSTSSFPKEVFRTADDEVRRRKERVTPMLQMA